MSGTLAALDKKHIWHPFTQMQEWAAQDPLIIERGDGMWLKDVQGKRYLDGVSSLWVTVHGHRHPVLDAAVKRQLGKIAHSTFLGLTHEPAIRLAERLVKIAPKGLTRVFYSDNGSTAVEVAVKMVYQYWRLRGVKTKTKFLSFDSAYHGDTLGSVSVGGISLFHEKFRPLLFENIFAPSPHCRFCTHRSPEECCRKPLERAEELLRKHHKEIAAAIIEPLNQAAAGMLVSPPGFLSGFAKLCKKYKVLLIADEVAMGFGRTGTMFACDREKVSPDFLCVAKSITGGYLPLAATLTRESVYRAFLGRHEEYKTFFHGHTYTANPLACAVALANLDLYKKTKLLEKLQPKIRILSQRLQDLARHPHVGDVRQVGFVVGIELVADKKTKAPYPSSRRMGVRVCRRARDYGVLLRPLGDVIVILPPLAIGVKDLHRILDAVEKAIGDVCA